MIKGGYILLARTILTSDVFAKPPLYAKVWLYLLCRARFTPYKQLRRGQLFTSVPEIIEATAWYVGARKERASKDQVYQVIEWLRKPHEDGTTAPMITTQKATHGTLITICNYDAYQDAGNYESNTTTKTKAKRKQRTPGNINKECINKEKNYNNDNNEKNGNTYMRDNAFENFWFIYDYKVGRKEALKKWALLNDEERKAIFLHIPQYIQSTPDKHYRKYPVSYITHRAWEDEAKPVTKPVQAEVKAHSPANAGFNEALSKISHRLQQKDNIQ